jgi:cyanophycinase-like exopeptidase
VLAGGIEANPAVDSAFRALAGGPGSHIVLIPTASLPKTELAMRELLDRGGVVGGESAGAMIQGSWLDTTDGDFTREIRALMASHAAGGGFGLLTRAAVFPHFDERGPESALKESAAHPNQLVIGIGNETALIVKGDQIEAVGRGTVSLYNASGSGASHVVMIRNGERYDLSARRRRTGHPQSPAGRSMCSTVYAGTVASCRFSSRPSLRSTV